jgi:tetratricopeptide (TPR) repeat protein
MRETTILLATALGVAITPLAAQEGGWLTEPPPAPAKPASKPDEKPARSKAEVRKLLEGLRQRHRHLRGTSAAAPDQRCEGMKPVELRERPLPPGTDQLLGVTPARIKQVPEAHAWHQKALDALKKGSLVEVVVAVRQAYQAGLTRSEADRVLGHALLQAENHRNGLLHMRRALEAPEERTTANFRALGKLHVLSGDPARAVRAFHDALAEDPDDDETHVLMAVTYDSVGHTPKVLEHSQKAIRIDPANKAKLKPFIRNSNVSKRIGCIVSKVLEDSKYERLTDEAIEGYAEEIGEILGEDGLRRGPRKPGPFAPTR